MDNKLKEAISKLKESKNILEKFSTREEVVEFLIKETKLPKEECIKAYDFLIKLDLDNK